MDVVVVIFGEGIHRDSDEDGDAELERTVETGGARVLGSSVGPGLARKGVLDGRKDQSLS